MKCLLLGNAREVDSLEEVLRMANVVGILHVTATQPTNNKSTYEVIALMKDCALMVKNAAARSLVLIDTAKQTAEIGKIADIVEDVFARNGYERQVIRYVSAWLAERDPYPRRQRQHGRGKGNIAVEVASSTMTSTDTAVRYAAIHPQQLDPCTHMHYDAPGVLSKIHLVLPVSGNDVTLQYLQLDRRTALLHCK
ncbi:unnamed protein product [Peronospora belbahrii]|uniref:Thioester reductase (TE) domain-containing protein n=1 Tax=Peronospora belbahrii TaxID=622444 RepID=A0AAU9L3M7_9STRA|nr:unnamed protein product [Peronospora belbahrii]